jgi:hypothetical protein
MPRDIVSPCAIALPSSLTLFLFPCQSCVLFPFRMVVRSGVMMPMEAEEERSLEILPRSVTSFVTKIREVLQWVVSDLQG